MRTLIGFLVLLLLQSGLCEEQLLLKASNDQDSKVESLLLRLDQAGRPTHLLHRREQRKERAYTPQRLASGVVLKKQSGRDLVILKTLSFNPEQGAVVELSYLYSGIPPEEYRSVTLTLKKQDALWSLFKTGNSHPIKGLKFQANLASVFGMQKAIGIRAVKFLR